MARLICTDILWGKTISLTISLFPGKTINNLDVKEVDARIFLFRADSSAVERLPYTQEVTGSNPVSPTIPLHLLGR